MFYWKTDFFFFLNKRSLSKWTFLSVHLNLQNWSQIIRLILHHMRHLNHTSIQSQLLPRQSLLHHILKYLTSIIIRPQLRVSSVLLIFVFCLPYRITTWYPQFLHNFVKLSINIFFFNLSQIPHFRFYNFYICKLLLQYLR